jgi:uncharacterized protein YhjY with autotransporter beta-barrel domain
MRRMRMALSLSTIRRGHAPETKGMPTTRGFPMTDLPARAARACFRLLALAVLFASFAVAMPAAAQADIFIDPSTLPQAEAGQPYSTQITAYGTGTAPYTFAIVAGALPSGLTLASDGTVSGTPDRTPSTTFNFTVEATDANGETGQGAVDIFVGEGPPLIGDVAITIPYFTSGDATTIPANIIDGQVMSIQVSSPPVHGIDAQPAGGGTTDMQYSPTAGYAGVDTFQYVAVNAYGASAPATVTVTIEPPTFQFHDGGPANATAGQSFRYVAYWEGGFNPYTLDVTGLPDGLEIVETTLGRIVIDGAPREAGTFTLHYTVTDGSTGDGPFSDSADVTLTVAPPVLEMTPNAGYFDGTYVMPFSQQFNVIGGSDPYTFTATGLPNGLTMGTDGLLSGSPTQGGVFPITVTATDSTGGPGSPFSLTLDFTIDINVPVVSIDPTSLDNGTEASPYSAQLTASGGDGTYAFWIVSGDLPPGIGFDGAGTIAGTPTQHGSYTFLVEVRDSNGYGTQVEYTINIAELPPVTGDVAVTATPNASTLIDPPLSGGDAAFLGIYTEPANGEVHVDGLRLVYNPAVNFAGVDSFTYFAANSAGPSVPSTVTVTVLPPPPMVVVDSGPATAQIGQFYSRTFTWSGGYGPYQMQVTGLPAGLVINATTNDMIVVAGTPTAAGDFTLVASATDSTHGDGPLEASEEFALTVAAPTLTLTPGATAFAATQGTPFTQSFAAAGGTAPFAYALSGTLPSGVTLTGDTLAGTPTQSGSFAFTVTATDSSTGTGAPFSVATSYTLDVAIAPPVAGAVSASVAYGSAATPITLALSGGSATSVAVASAPGNGVATASGTTITYAPAAGFSGTDTFTYTATNASGTSTPAAVTVTVGVPTIVIADGGPANGAVGAAYSRTFTASGGTGPYTFAASGLPSGVTVTATTANTVTVAGTPTAAGSFPLTIAATDSSRGTGPFTASQEFALTVAAPTLTLLPAAAHFDAVYDADFSQAFAAGGGIAPHTYALTGTLPAGLTFSGNTLSGRATQPGEYAFTVTATDSTSGTGAPFTVAVDYTLSVAAPTIVLAPAALADGERGQPYAAQLSASGGSVPYAFALTSGVLPAGVTLSPAGALAGTPTASGTFGFTVTASDANGQQATRTYSLVIVERAPIVADDAATAVSGLPSRIAVTANDSGGITSVAVASAPANGSVAVSGLELVYTANATFSGADSFTYTASSPGGVSLPATVRVTVNPRPVAASRTVAVEADSMVSVSLTDGASGGPFTDATLVAFAPVAAGNIVLVETGGSFSLEFTPAVGFVGDAVARYTLTNAWATSVEATITFTVAARPDPSLDPGVKSTIDAQAQSAARFASSQIDNFQNRLGGLHGGEGDGFSNGLGFAGAQRCPQRPVTDLDSVFGDCADGDGVGNGLGAAPGSGATGQRGGNGAALGFWTAGTIRSGAMDGRSGSEHIDFETDGISAGVDRRINGELAIGAGVGYGQDDSAIGNDGGRVDGKAWALALYASWHRDAWFVDGLLGWQQLEWQLRRFDSGAGVLVDGDRDGNQWFGSLTAGADLGDGAVRWTPYARLDLARATLDAYSEEGGPGVALHYSEMDVDTSIANIGVRLDFRHDTGWGVLTPQVRAEFQRDLHDDAVAELRYADMLTGPFYRVETTSFDRSRFMLGLGAILQPGSDWSLRLEYRGLVGSDGQRDNGLMFSAERSY